jgi:hypothetical protein
MRGAAVAPSEEELLAGGTSSSSPEPDVFLKHLLLFLGTFAAVRQAGGYSRSLYHLTWRGSTELLTWLLQW